MSAISGMNEQPLSVSPYNVPNFLTLSRLVLAIIVILAITWKSWWMAFLLFGVAASTDWADGYWARKYGQITKIGRIFDPFVDKFIICGTFVALVAVPESGISVGLAVLIFARELLVTSLRGIIEGSGKDFSARWLGKWKMGAQCAAGLLVLLSLALESPPEWVAYLKRFALLATGVLTVWSGYDYVMAAGRVLSSEAPARPDEPPHVG